MTNKTFFSNQVVVAQCKTSQRLYHVSLTSVSLSPSNLPLNVGNFVVNFVVLPHQGCGFMPLPHSSAPVLNFVLLVSPIPYLCRLVTESM
jgi:hypothetical protein